MLEVAHGKECECLVGTESGPWMALNKKFCAQEEKEVGFGEHMTVFCLPEVCTGLLGAQRKVIPGFGERIWKRWCLNCVLKGR